MAITIKQSTLKIEGAYKTTDKYPGNSAMLNSGEMIEFYLHRDDKPAVQLFAFAGEVVLADGTKIAATVPFTGEELIEGKDLADCFILSGDVAEAIAKKGSGKLKRVINPTTMRKSWAMA